MPNRRYFDPKTHSCSHCGMLLTKEAFKFHREGECFMIEVKNKELEKKIKEFKGGE